MSAGSPEVISGTRAPRTVRLEQAREREAQRDSTVAPVAVADYDVYVSRDRRYRVQITAPQKLILSDGRHQSGGKMLVAQFEDNVYRNNHPDLKVRKLIKESLESNPYFGPFGKSTAHFWLASDQNEKTAAARVASAMATLKSLPKEVVAEYIGQLEQGSAADHALPQAK